MRFFNISLITQVFYAKIIKTPLSPSPQPYRVPLVHYPLFREIQLSNRNLSMGRKIEEAEH
jgi:hypothetical protein